MTWIISPCPICHHVYNKAEFSFCPNCKRMADEAVARMMPGGRGDVSPNAFELCQHDIQVKSCPHCLPTYVADLERQLAEAHKLTVAINEQRIGALVELADAQADVATLKEMHAGVCARLEQAREVERLAKILLGRDWSVVIRVLRDQDMTGAASDLDDMVGALAALDAGKTSVDCRCDGIHAAMIDGHPNPEGAEEFRDHYGHYVECQAYRAGKEAGDEF